MYVMNIMWKKSVAVLTFIVIGSSAFIGPLSVSFSKTVISKSHACCSSRISHGKGSGYVHSFNICVFDCCKDVASGMSAMSGACAQGTCANSQSPAIRSGMVSREIVKNNVKKGKQKGFSSDIRSFAYLIHAFQPKSNYRTTSTPISMHVNRDLFLSIHAYLI